MWNTVQSLLDKVSYDSESDYLVLAGDIISKGPDSLTVLDLARKIGAHCVRGNHEDRILLHYHDIQRRKRKHHKALEAPESEEGEREEEEENDGQEEGDEDDDGNDDGAAEGKEFGNMGPEVGERESPSLSVEKRLARSLSKKQAEWLDACPLVLRASKVPGLGQYYIVHAGLVHGIELESQVSTVFPVCIFRGFMLTESAGPLGDNDYENPQPPSRPIPKTERNALGKVLEQNGEEEGS